MAVRPFAALAVIGVASVAHATDICPPRSILCPPTAVVPGVTPPVAPGMVPPVAPPPPLDPVPPAAPGAMPPAPQLPADNNVLAQASAGGTGASESLFPTVFGDLFGGGFVAGPLPVQVDPQSGRILSALPVLVAPNGAKLVVSSLAPPGGPLVATPPPGTPVTPVVVPFLRPPGTTFDASLIPFVSKIPTANRGTFKLTENDTPRPTDRVYFIYNYYDDIAGGTSPLAPRINLHQETFGVEKALFERRFSVGARLPYNQFTSDRFFGDTSFGDLTLIAKAVIREDRGSGDILSGGLAVTVPTGTVSSDSSITGQTIHPTLLQPYLGYLKTFLGGDAFAQGFTAVVVPTDSSDVTLYTQTLAVGYFLYRNPDGRLRSLVPVAEAHLNVPLNHRGINSQPVGFVDTLTILGGAHANLGSNATIGAAVGAPVTGPRPFSLQVTVNVNVRF